MKRLALFVSLLISGTAFSQKSEPVFEDFESFDRGDSITEKIGWSGFAGFRDEILPMARVVASGPDSKALGISHSEPFRTDNWGLQFQLPQEYDKGVIWIQCKFKPPVKFAGGLTLDARGPGRREILARIAAAPFENKSTGERELRWHCTWSRPHWRLYTLSELDVNRWYTVTARLDLDRRICAAWLDDQLLCEEAPLSGGSSFSQLYLGFGGLGESAAMIDDLLVSTKAPAGYSDPVLLPNREKEHVFRFAGIGDPQLGFGGYDSDKVRFGLAVDQINRAGAELSLILGDMVHENKNEQAYIDLATLGKGLKQPLYARGNHEELDLFLKHFSEKENHSTVHKGVRFVVVDAIGNQRGLGEEQFEWIEKEFSEAENKEEEIVLALHVSPWQDNRKGVGKYNQIGPGRDRLRELMKEYQVLLCLSGHYHSGLWGAKEEETNYLVLGGTALVKGGTYGWCVFDVYPDRVVMHQKPLFFGYEKADVSNVHALQGWIPYEKLREMYPYIQQGPLTIPRHRPVQEE